MTYDTWADIEAEGLAILMAHEYDADGHLVTNSQGHPAYDRLRANVIDFARERGYRLSEVSGKEVIDARSVGNLSDNRLNQVYLRLRLMREVAAALDWMNTQADGEYSGLALKPDAERPLVLREVAAVGL